MKSEVNARFALQRSHLFRDLQPDIFDQFAENAHTRSYAKDQNIFCQGQAGEAICSVISGKVCISAIGGGGMRLSLDIMEPADLFGEISVIDGRPHLTTATAMVPSEILIIGRDHFLEFLKSDSDISFHFLQHFCGRIRSSTELAEDYALLSGRRRLAKQLLRLATIHGYTSNSTVMIKISQRELGDFLGMSRQLVNQYLRDWSKQGWVKLTRGRIAILNVDSLQQCSELPGSH
jgi:CRP/FNR family cyclic AMP-dependent transcriptional regulator